ncbi:MAG: membrane protein insertase YidC [Gammaproteobacteria bacterium]|nr:membrane protein insertase YidC [Gammaproteobacteria bacterium]
MQTQRVILFGALALVLVMIWQSWMEFEQRHTRGVGESLATSEGGLSVGENSDSDTMDDVPNAPTTTQASNEGGLEVENVPDEVSTDGQIISVSTDLINARIDTRGGDLIRVELKKHPVSVDAPDQPFVLMHRDPGGLFVAQNGLIGNGRDYPNHNVEFATDTLQYVMGDENSLEVILNWTAPDNVVYQKVFTFTRNSYRIEVDFKVDNRSATQWDGYAYGQLRQTEIQQEGSMGFLGRLPSFNGAAIYTKEEKYDKIDYETMQESNLNVTTPSGWVAMLQHYFVASWLPGGSDSYQFYTGVTNKLNPEYRVGYKTTQPVTIAAGSQGEVKTSVFVGPKEQARLEKQGAEGLTLTVDYGFLTPVSDPLFWLLTHIHDFVKNWGWSIVLLTVLVKAIFYPLSAASYKSMAKMKRLQPRLQTLKERYSDDKQKFQQEMMKLYKTEKVNPAGGCLPILVQIPVFMALYWVLLESVELRQASFMLWLNDLSLPDPYFVLPVIMGASMLAQHFLNPSPVDPIQKKIMLAMPIVFTVFFLWFPAGLVLYWVVNNILSIAQQYYITKKYQ